jgi:hypothetical protein
LHFVLCDAAQVTMATVPALKHLLQKTLHLCNERHIPTCLAYGTLLGFRRNGKIIPHDDDVDLVVHEKYRAQLEALSRDLCDATKGGAKSDLLMIPRPDMIKIEYYDRATGTRVHGDIFYYSERTVSGRKVAHIAVEDDEFAWQVMHPLRPVVMYGQSTCIPNDTDVWLREQYGANYMTPIKKDKGRSSTLHYLKLRLKTPLQSVSMLYKQYSFRHPVLVNGSIGVVALVIAAILAGLVWRKARPLQKAIKA